MEIKDATAIIVCIVLFALGVIAGGTVFYAASIIVLLIIALDFYWLWSSLSDIQRRLSADVDMPGHKWHPGSVVTVSARIRYSGTAKYRVRLSKAIDGQAMVLKPMEKEAVLSSDNPLRLSMSIQPLKIGVVIVHPLKISLESRFFKGHVNVGHVERPAVSIGINYAQVHTRSAIGRTMKYSDLLHDTNTGQHTGIDIYNVRPYIPGDQLRNIDWVRSSRENMLVVKVYDESRVRPVFFLIDVDLSMVVGEKMSELDSAINLVSSLASKLIIDNTMFGLISFSKSDIIDVKHLGIGRDHIRSAKAMLSNMVPVEEPGNYRAASIPINKAESISRMLGDVEGFDLFASVMKETLKDQVINVKGDGYARAVLKACHSSNDPCQLIVVTNLSMGMASLMNGIRLARYYGHSVTVVMTPHVWYHDKDLVEIDKFYEKYLEMKKHISNIRSLDNVKVVDLYSGDRVEEVLYRNASFDPSRGIRR